MDIGDFFDLEQGPARDRWGRPLLIPRGGTKEDRRWYTRASSLADYMEDFFNVQRWEKRYIARGMAMSPDLARLAAAEVYTTGFGKPDDKTNRRSGAILDDIIARALDRARIDEKADYGTAVHLRTEPGNEGQDIDDMQTNDVDSFWECLKAIGAVIIGTELFTACDEVWVAGTFDHLMYIPGVGIVVTDKKTSSSAKASYRVQLAPYSRADLYDPETDQRMTLEEYVASQGWDPALIRRDVGYLFWIKNGKTTPRWLDLDQGWESAKIAAHHVRDVHRKAGTAPDSTDEMVAMLARQRETLLGLLAGAPTVESLLNLWNDKMAQAVWTDDHTAAAMARKEALS